MPDLPAETLKEVVIDPRFVVSVQSVLGAPGIVVVQIEHPRLGPLSFAWPKDEAEKMYAALGKAIT